MQLTLALQEAYNQAIQGTIQQIFKKRLPDGPALQHLNVLSPNERRKLLELATTLMKTASEGSRIQARAIIRKKLNRQQLQELHSQNEDLAHMFYQYQAFNMLIAKAESKYYPAADDAETT